MGARALALDRRKLEGSLFGFSAANDWTLSLDAPLPMKWSRSQPAQSCPLSIGSGRPEDLELAGVLLRTLIVANFCDVLPLQTLEEHAGRAITGLASHIGTPGSLFIVLETPRGAIAGLATAALLDDSDDWPGVKFEPDTWELEKLYINEAWQRGGHGRRLLKAIEDAMRAEGAKKVMIAVCACERGERTDAQGLATPRRSNSTRDRALFRPRSHASMSETAPMCISRSCNVHSELDTQTSRRCSLIFGCLLLPLFVCFLSIV